MTRDANTKPERLSSAGVTLSGIKIVRTFRLSLESVELVQRAAEESGASQGELIEQCIIQSVAEVSARLLAERRKREEQRAAALARVVVRPVGRPRKDGAATKGAAAPAGLKKSQRS